MAFESEYDTTKLTATDSISKVSSLALAINRINNIGDRLDDLITRIENSPVAENREADSRDPRDMPLIEVLGRGPEILEKQVASNLEKINYLESLLY